MADLILLSSAATVRTAATLAEGNIESRIRAAFNTMVQAWQSARATMWSTATDPQDIADAMGTDGTLASDWFTVFDELQTWMNAYIPAESVLPDFVHPDYVVTANSDGSVTISGTLDGSAE